MNSRSSSSGDRIVNLVEDGVDAAVSIGRLEDSSQVARNVGATRRVVVASPSYLKRRKPPGTPDEIAAHDVIQFRGLSPTPEWRFSHDGAEERVTFNPWLRDEHGRANRGLSGPRWRAAGRSLQR